MNAAKEMAERLKGMLTRDKMGVRDGFKMALNSDLHRVLTDYFELEQKPETKIELCDDGGYVVTVSARAARIKQFDTTADAPRR